MTRIYVRVNRNRWVPIGEVDLDGRMAVYKGRKGGPVFLDGEVSDAITKATVFTRQMLEAEKKGKMTRGGAWRNAAEFYRWEKLEALRDRCDVKRMLERRAVETKRSRRIR
jgi:hypothetical protein